MNEEVIGTLRGRLSDAEEKLTLTVTGEVYRALKRLSPKMRNASTPREVVEIALELIIKAEDKEIALIDQGRIVATYNLWKK